MPRFTGRHATSVDLPMAPPAAAAAFADLDRQIACHPELAAAEKRGPDTIHFRMKEMAHGPVKFAGAYTLRFTTEGTTVRWRTLDGNVDVHGEATFAATPGGCRMACAESVATELDVNPILAKVLRPIVEAMMGRGSKNFVERMEAELRALTPGARATPR